MAGKARSVGTDTHHTNIGRENETITARTTHIDTDSGSMSIMRATVGHIALMTVHTDSHRQGNLTDHLAQATTHVDQGPEESLLCTTAACLHLPTIGDLGTATTTPHADTGSLGDPSLHAQNTCIIGIQVGDMLLEGTCRAQEAEILIGERENQKRQVKDADHQKAAVQVAAAGLPLPRIAQVKVSAREKRAAHRHQ